MTKIQNWLESSMALFDVFVGKKKKKKEEERFT